LAKQKNNLIYAKIIQVSRILSLIAEVWFFFFTLIYMDDMGLEDDNYDPKQKHEK
jgi:hypothetical protein